MSETEDRSADGPHETSILGSSAVMAAGTVVSRTSGFVRSALLAAALGTQLHADVFTIANTIPNMLYILLAGGVFNAVLVPQLVRAMKQDPDGGEAYTNRIVTLAALFLAGVTAVLVLAAPWVMRLFLDGSFFSPDLAPQREAVVDFARFCLPQVFFYGMFVLVGQILNARGRFGPMMWAPIANNVISVAVLGLYLVLFGATHAAAACGGYTTGQELLLGVGSTLGIACQLLILVPYLRSAGFRFSARFDFRGTGLGHTLRLGTWTVLFVVVNQLAYTVVVRMASSGTAQSALGSCGQAAAGAATGYTVYANAFLLVMVPHSVVTVSLATAMLPRLSSHAADADLSGVAHHVATTLRTTHSLIVPFALLLPVVALDLSNLLWGYGAAERTYEGYAPTLALFAVGLLFFTTHYLMLRGFYALEQTRTVFWVQCVIAAINVVLAVLLTRGGEPDQTAPRLVVAYAASYAVGSVISYLLLRHRLGGLETARLLRFLARILVAGGIAALAALAVALGVHALWDGSGKLRALTTCVACGVVDGAVLLALARALRVREVTGVVDLVSTRLRGRSGR